MFNINDFYCCEDEYNFVRVTNTVVVIVNYSFFVIYLRNAITNCCDYSQDTGSLYS